jgi:hypothetical protein
LQTGEQCKAFEEWRATVTEDNSAIVLEVFSRVRDADPRVADLYAPEATLAANGAVHAGRDAIRAFYQGLFAITGPQPVVCGLWRNGDSYAALVEVRFRSGTVGHVVDVFDASGGTIRSMRVFAGALGSDWVPQPAG